MRNESGTGCCVAVSLRSAGRDVVVTRYRKHPKHKNSVFLSVDGQDVSRGTSTETTRAIEQQIVGMDFQLYATTVAFGARDDVRSFFSASDAERKRILEVLLGLEVYQAAHARALARVRDATTRRDGAESARTRIEERVATLREFVAQAEIADVEHLKFLHSRARLRVRRTRTRCVRLQEVAAEEARAVNVATQKWHAVFRAWQTERSMRRHAREQAQGVVTEIDRRLARTQAEMEAARARVDRVQAVGTPCGECARPLTEDVRARMQVPLLEAFRELGRKADRLRVERSEAQVSLDELADDLQMPVAPYEVTLCGVAKGVADEMFRRADEGARRAEYEEETARVEYERVAGDLEQRRRSLEGAEEAHRAAVRAFDAIGEELEAYTVVIEMFSNTGLKSYLIEATLPAINRIATGYSQRLLGSGTLVRLSPTRSLRTTGAEREELTVEARIPGCSETYATASKGQRRRLDLALLLALRDVASSRARKAPTQLFADEVFDGFDTAGTEAVAELLREYAVGRSVYLVTHNPDLRSAADRVLVVRHRHGVATVEGE